MSKYIATVRYEVGTATMEEEFAVRAKGRQYVKEQYHRYTHENYGHLVSREFEDFHRHPVGEGIFDHRLVDIRPVDEVDLHGLPPIKKV